MPEIQLLIITAASIGFFHTLLGPDHYLPFIVMAQSGKWSLLKTTLITFASGLAHVLSSVFLGLIGITFGVALQKLEIFESFRGDLAAWLLIGFGLVYFVWGVQKAYKNSPHSHAHEKKDSVTPWVIFLIFLFGPCELLIPVLMYPASQGNVMGLIQVILAFGVVTILTMMSVVIFTTFGLNSIPGKNFHKYSHALAGFTIFICGMSIQFLGL